MIKNGVDVLGISPQMVLAYTIAARVYHNAGYECIITSVVDGKHGSHSHHYKGCAIDLRINNLAPKDVASIVAQLKTALGRQYQVLLEKDHIHIEFDPA